MSVLSRPVRHHASAETQRTASIPLQRTDPQPLTESAPAARTSMPTRPTSRPAGRRGIRPTFVAAGLLALLAAVGGVTWALVDDGGGTAASTSTTTVDVQAPNTADLGRDAATAARGNDASRATDAQRDAVLGQRGSITE